MRRPRISGVLWLMPADSPARVWVDSGVAILLALFILFTHRGNLARLRAGTEPRFERARVWTRLRRNSA